MEGVMTMIMRLARKARENVSQKELAQAMEITPATLTVMLRRMDAKRLVSRVRDPQDMRVTQLNLTESGREKVREIETVITQANDVLDGLFTPEELRAVRGMMQRVCVHLGTMAQKQGGDGPE